MFYYFNYEGNVAIHTKLLQFEFRVVHVEPSSYIPTVTECCCSSDPRNVLTAVSCRFPRMQASISSQSSSGTVDGGYLYGELGWLLSPTHHFSTLNHCGVPSGLCYSIPWVNTCFFKVSFCVLRDCLLMGFQDTLRRGRKDLREA